MSLFSNRVPPFEMRVKTKIAKKFFNILEKNIPPGHKLRPLLNRHTVKLSYSVMPNMKRKISMQNKKIRSEAATLRKEEEKRFMQQLPQPRPPRGRPPSKNPNCNCENGVETCELNGKCMKEKDIIYNAKVTRLDNFEVEKYSGAHEGPFKTRIYGHRTNMRNRHQKGTGLSKYVWKLKGNAPHPIPYEVEWSILAHAKPFDPVTGVCRLCLLEAYFIMFDPEDCTLNTREEFWGSCPHRAKLLLSKEKG